MSYRCTDDAARALLEIARVFYSDPKNFKKFQKWQAENELLPQKKENHKEVV